jgi:hypothetical protein
MPPDLRANTGRRGGKQATNGLSYGSALIKEKKNEAGERRGSGRMREGQRMKSEKAERGEEVEEVRERKK